MDFLLNKYVKMIEHENDGIIFNHEEKEYVLGTTNPAYVKWKPEHLNTIDFMIVPNANLEDRYGKRVLDLYVAIQDADLNRYTRQFYAFTVVNELDFDHINELIEKKEEERFLAQEENHG
jgi:ATP-dependent DNA ligase